jgi:hypothetical protein
LVKVIEGSKSNKAKASSLASLKAVYHSLVYLTQLFKLSTAVSYDSMLSLSLSEASFASVKASLKSEAVSFALVN